MFYYPDVFLEYFWMFEICFCLRIISCFFVILKCLWNIVICNMKYEKYESFSYSVGSNCWWLCGLSPARLPCPWDSPGKNLVMHGHFLLQGSIPALFIVGRFFTTEPLEKPNTKYSHPLMLVLFLHYRL